MVEGSASPPPPSQPQRADGSATFLQQWQTNIQPRLGRLLASLGGQGVAKSLALAQVGTSN